MDLSLISELTGAVSEGVGYHVLDREQVLELPQADVFRFFSDAANLRRITPASLGFRFEQAPPMRLEVGSEILYRIRLAGVPLRWTTRITEWDPPHRFADLQARGPYAYWLHTHTFSPLDGGRTLMRDRVIYRVPFGWLGEVARRIFVQAQLRKIFDHRERAVGSLMLSSGPPATTGQRSPRIRLLAAAGVGVALTGAVIAWRRARSA